MKDKGFKRIIFLTVAVLMLMASGAWAGDFQYGDYVEAFNSPVSTIYIYKSSITQAGDILSIKALELKPGLTAPNSGKRDPYIAIKYDYKFNCMTKKYAGDDIAVLFIERGWVYTPPDQVREDQNNWRNLPGRESFLDALPMFCKGKK